MITAPMACLEADIEVRPATVHSSLVMLPRKHAHRLRSIQDVVIRIRDRDGADGSS